MKRAPEGCGEAVSNAALLSRCKELVEAARADLRKAFRALWRKR